MVKLSRTESGDILLQTKIIEPSIYKKVALVEELFTIIDSEKTALEPLVQPNEVQGKEPCLRVLLGNLRRAFCFSGKSKGPSKLGPCCIVPAKGGTSID